MGKPGELKAPEGMWGAFRCAVLEEILLGRFLFFYIHLISLMGNKIC